MPKICPYCGSKYQCVEACLQARESLSRNLALDKMAEIIDENDRNSGVIQLEFLGDLDTQKILINRLSAQWRWAMEIVLVEDEGRSWYIVNLARHKAELGGPLKAVYEVSMGGFREIHTHKIWRNLLS